MTRMKRNVLRLPLAMRERLDDLAEMAGNDLQREVSRAAVVRAAVTAWLAISAESDPAQVIGAIRAAMVKRGRKPRLVAVDPGGNPAMRCNSARLMVADAPPPTLFAPERCQDKSTFAPERCQDKTPPCPRRGGKGTGVRGNRCIPAMTLW